MADIVLHIDIEKASTTTVSDLIDIKIQPKILGLSQIAENVCSIRMKSNVLSEH